MKRTGLILGFLLALATLCSRQAANVSAADDGAVSGPFSPQELAKFRALGAIDTHAHVFVADPSFIAMLRKLDLHILEIGRAHV